MSLTCGDEDVVVDDLAQTHQESAPADPDVMTDTLPLQVPPRVG